MARCEPETLEILQQALAAGRAALVGGEFMSRAGIAAAAPEAIDFQLSRGLADYALGISGSRPAFRAAAVRTDARAAADSRAAGFTAAFHCTLDDGRFPAGNQGRIQWEGIDGTAIEALGCVPLDAGRADRSSDWPRSSATP